MEQELDGIEALNRLIEVCKDSEKGFLYAASAWKAMRNYARFASNIPWERGAFVRELQNEVRWLHGNPADLFSDGHPSAWVER